MLVHFILSAGGDVFINPTHVTAIIKSKEDSPGKPRTEIFTTGADGFWIVQGDVGHIADRLTWENPEGKYVLATDYLALRAEIRSHLEHLERRYDAGVREVTLVRDEAYTGDIERAPE